MARVTYRGFDVPDGAAIPDVPSDLRVMVDGVWLNTAKRLASATNNASIDCGSTTTTLVSLNVTLTVPRYLLVAAYLVGAQITAAATITNATVSPVPGNGSQTPYLFYIPNLAAGVSAVGSLSVVALYPAGTTNVRLLAVSNNGALRVGAGNASLGVIDTGVQ